MNKGGRPKAPLILSDDERQKLQTWAARPKSTQRLALRARIVDELHDPASSAALYRANFAYDLAQQAALVLVPTLIVEIATPEEDSTIGRQGERLAKRMRNAEVAVVEAPQAHGVTLERQAEQLADILLAFLEAA